MVHAYWSVKGGVGTTVVAVSTALALGRPEAPVLLVDLDGDVPCCLGIAEPAGPGVAEWLAASDGVPPDALARLETEVRPGLWLLHRGCGDLSPVRTRLLLQILASSGRPVIVDCGRIDRDPAARVMAAEADRSILVARCCLLGLRRAAEASVSPSGIVVVRDPGRSIGPGAVAEVLGAPVLAEVAVDPAIGRAVDAGLLASRRGDRLGDVLRAVTP